MVKLNCVLLTAVTLALAPVWASAQVIYSDDFNTDTSANYNVYVTAGASAGPSGDATFAYNYGAAPGSGGLAIPVAPHTTDGSTIGLRIRTDNLQNAAAAAIVGATEVVTKSLVLSTPFVVSVDVWCNYIGGTSLAASGSNGSTGAAVGIGTSGTSIQYIAANDGLLHEGFGDNGGGANQAYRLYVDASHPNPTTKGYWAAGTSSTSASYTDPYYSFLTSQTAPSGQTTAFPTTQGGSTPVGVLGFAWHTWTITDDGANIIWAIDGHTMTTVPVADVTFGGSQVSLGNDDTGTSGNSTAANQLLNAQIFDNFTVTLIPEPSTLSLLAIGAIGLLAYRRK
jgi:hypothetical protein